MSCPDGAAGAAAGERAVIAETLRTKLYPEFSPARGDSELRERKKERKKKRVGRIAPKLELFLKKNTPAPLLTLTMTKAYHT